MSQKPWKFVRKHLRKVVATIPALGFLCGVAVGVANIDPTVPGNPVIGCFLLGVFGALFLGYMGISLVLNHVSTSQDLEDLRRKKVLPDDLHEGGSFLIEDPCEGGGS